MSLKKQTFSGVKWTTASSLVNMVVQLIQLAILARLLNREDFGLMAIVMVVIGFSQLFIDMGVSNAIIYKQDITKNELSSLYWLNIFIGVLFFIIIIISSPFIADFYDNEKLISLINLVAITFLIKPWGQQLMVMLHKEMQFNATSKTEITARLISFTTVIALAYNEYGVYSLATGTIVYAVCSTIGYNLFGRKIYQPKFHFNRKEIREYINFGLFQMGDKFLNYFASQMDTILIGKLLGVEILGVYNVAKDITSKPYGVINPIITKVTFPLMSKINKEISKLKLVYIKTINYLSFINIPIYILIAVFAKALVISLFGIKWAQAIPIIQILALSFILRSIGSPAGSLLLSKGKANIAFYWNVIIFLLYPFYLFLGSRWGIFGVAIGLLALQISLFYPNWRFIVHRFTGINLREYIKSFSSPLFFSLIAILCALTINYFIDNNIFKALVGISVFSVFYILCIILFEHKLFKDLLSAFPKSISRPIKKLIKY